MQFKLAEMATDLVASRLLVRHAAKALDMNSTNAARLAAMAKLFATDKCFNVSVSAQYKRNYISYCYRFLLLNRFAMTPCKCMEVMAT